MARCQSAFPCARATLGRTTANEARNTQALRPACNGARMRTSCRMTPGDRFDGHYSFGIRWRVSTLLAAGLSHRHGSHRRVAAMRTSAAVSAVLAGRALRFAARPEPVEGADKLRP